MTEHARDPGLVTPGPAADGLTGQEGSAHLPGAPGVTSPAAADNAHGRQRLAGICCDALEGRGPRGRRAWFMTAAAGVMSGMAAGGGGSHSG
jgi:hypothetical protein